MRRNKAEKLSVNNLSSKSSVSSRRSLLPNLLWPGTPEGKNPSKYRIMLQIIGFTSSILYSISNQHLPSWSPDFLEGLKMEESGFVKK